MQAEEFPITFIYSQGYRNVSGQVLEIENAQIPDGHIWNQLDRDLYLSPDQISLRGAATQALIDRGYIAPFVYSPTIPLDYFFMEDSEGTWFKMNMEELDLSGHSDFEFLPNDEKNYRSNLGWVVECVATYPVGSYVVDFDILVPDGQAVIFKLDESFNAGLRYLQNDRFRMDKRNKGDATSISQPLAFPYTQKLSFAVDGESVRMTINPQGCVEFEVE